MSFSVCRNVGCRMLCSCWCTVNLVAQLSCMYADNPGFVGFTKFMFLLSYWH
jgi:hypothetical protein